MQTEYDEHEIYYFFFNFQCFSFCGRKVCGRPFNKAKVRALIVRLHYEPDARDRRKLSLESQLVLKLDRNCNYFLDILIR